MSSFFSNRTYLVTGGNSGIGKAIVLDLLQSGAKVIAIARDEAKFEQFRKGISQEESERLTTISKNLAEEIDTLPKFLEEIATVHGKLNGIVLAAGVNKILPLQSLNQSKINQIFDVNFTANLMLIKGFAKKSVRSGEGDSIVVISSIMSFKAEMAATIYAASKAALDAAVRNLALELAKDGIRINSVQPGHVRTELLTENKNLSPDYLANLEAKYPLGLPDPQDIADTVHHLLSNKSQKTTGTMIVVDSGVSGKV